MPIGVGWLRAAHRKLQPEESKPYRPVHTHDEAWPLQPGEPAELDIEVWPTCIVAPPGYRLALTVRGGSPPAGDRLSCHSLEAHMGSPKDEVSSLLEKLPDDASYEDIQYHLYVLEKVRRGLGRADTEGVIPHEEARARLGKWLAP